MFNIRDDITWVKRNSDNTYSQTSNRLELGILVGVLKSHPNLVIAIESHTDSRGSHAYNEWLSKQRAISTRNWLIREGGIAPHRLCAMAFGETELVTDCPDGVKCTEEEHDRNRRSEYRVISGLEGCNVTDPRRPCITETTHTNWRRR
jgi:outer membrane protein OmpA-like peptidoglycan-associated protein